MTFEEAYDRIPGQGWLSEKEAKLLWNAVHETEGPILEVGCYCGRSTALLAATGRHVYSVDPFAGFDSDYPSGDEIESIWRRNMQDRGIHNVELFRRRIEDWDLLPIGFAFLDGDHTYEGTLAQMQIAMAAGAKTFCVHDYALDGGGAAIHDAIIASPVYIRRVVERMAWCQAT